jgi:uncharacterized protein
MSVEGEARNPTLLMPAGAAARPARSARSLAGPGWALALVVAMLILGAGLFLSRAGYGDALSLSLVLGAAFGFVLQRSRFCFYCGIREWIEEREPDGVLGLLAAMAAGALGTALVLGAWMPDPTTGRLPPDAFIGPIAWTLVFGGLAFGAGMSISGSCISAHLYRLGEGSPTAPFAIIGTLAGFVLGFATWNGLYLDFVQGAPVVWLPAWTGYPGWIALTLIVLVALSWPLLLRRSARRAAVRAELDRYDRAPALAPLAAVFTGRWPGWLGGLFVGALAAFAYLRVAPLGVTAELSARARDIGASLDAVPSSLLGLEGLRGCVSIVADALLSNNGVFVLAMVGASFAAALASGQFQPQWPKVSQIVRGLVGGLALGWGAMVALGCSIGTLLSGIMAGALSGWVFALAMIAGLVVVRRLDRALFG